MELTETTYSKYLSTNHGPGAPKITINFSPIPDSIPRQSNPPPMFKIRSRSEVDKFLNAFLSPSTRVSSSSALVSWPSYPSPQPQAKALFQYTSKELSTQLFANPVLRQSLMAYLSTQNNTLFDRHIAPLFTAFIENLLLEINNLFPFPTSHHTYFYFWGKGREEKTSKEDKKRYSNFMTRRVNVEDLLCMIWEWKAQVWDQPRIDERGERYWASNVEGVRGSKAMRKFVGELRRVRGEVWWGGVEVEAI